MPVLYLTEQGASVHKDGELFVIMKEGKVLEKIPIIKVEQIVIFGNVNLTTPAIHTILANGIDCVFCSSYGKYHGRLISNESKFGALRQKQMETRLDERKTAELARSFVLGKITNEILLLRRYEKEADVRAEIEELSELGRKAARSWDLEEIRGFEGAASACYYKCLRKLLRKDFGYRGRTKRPPKDPVNSMLSFGYTLLTYGAQAAIHTVGLDPYLGFLHAPEHSRPSLALDLVEEFRAVIEALVIWMVNTGTAKEEDFFFEEDEGAVLLTQEGMRKFIRFYEERMQQLVFHPRIQGKTTRRRCLELQAREIADVILGRKERYKPFTLK